MPIWISSLKIQMAYILGRIAVCTYTETSSIRWSVAPKNACVHRLWFMLSLTLRSARHLFCPRNVGSLYLYIMPFYSTISMGSNGNKEQWLVIVFRTEILQGLMNYCSLNYAIATILLMQQWTNPFTAHAVTPFFPNFSFAILQNYQLIRRQEKIEEAKCNSSFT